VKILSLVNSAESESSLIAIIVGARVIALLLTCPTGDKVAKLSNFNSDIEPDAEIEESLVTPGESLF